MGKEIIVGTTDYTVDVFVQDATSGVGAGLAGLVFNSTGLACYYRKGATGSATQLTLATQTVGGAHSDGGFVEIQATNMKGLYRLDFSDTMLASLGTLKVYLYGAANMVPVVLEIEIVAMDKYDAIYVGSVTGASTTTTLIDSALTQGADNFWKDRAVIFITGSLKYQMKKITAFDAGLDKLTYDAMTAAASAGDRYIIV